MVDHHCVEDHLKRTCVYCVLRQGLSEKPFDGFEVIDGSFRRRLKVALPSLSLAKELLVVAVKFPLHIIDLIVTALNAAYERVHLKFILRHFLVDSDLD